MTRPLAISLLLACASASFILPGCAAAPTAKTVDLAPDRYPEAFDAAREVLREHGFRLAYVDARAGVIESEPKSTAGLATPGDSEQSSLAQEWEDLTNEHDRVVRIRFVSDEGQPVDSLGASLTDRTAQAPVRAEVEVMVYRLRRPGWRLETETPSRSTRANDPLLTAQGMGPRHATALGPDNRLAARIAQDLNERLGGAESASAE